MLAIAAKKLKKDQTEFIFNVIKNSDSTSIIENFLKKQIMVFLKLLVRTIQVHIRIFCIKHFDQLFYGLNFIQNYFKIHQNFLTLV